MSSPNTLEITRIVSMPFDENTYVLRTGDSTACVVIDPGLEPEKVTDFIDKARLRPVAIVCTHGHSDHIAGNAALKARWPECPLVIGHNDASKLTDPVGNLSAMFGLPIQSPPADRTLVEGDRFEAAGLVLRVLETPGHSSGHVVYVLDEAEPCRLIGGDMLFREGVGRTDFPDSDSAAFVASVRDKLYKLPDDTIVYPGHGPETTIGHEKENNPWIRA